MATNKKGKGLLGKLNGKELGQVLKNVKNSDTSKAVESFNEAIKQIEVARKNSIPDEGLMRIRYDAFRK